MFIVYIFVASAVIAALCFWLNYKIIIINDTLELLIEIIGIINLVIVSISFFAVVFLVIPNALFNNNAHETIPPTRTIIIKEEINKFE